VRNRRQSGTARQTGSDGLREFSNSVLVPQSSCILLRVERPFFDNPAPLNKYTRKKEFIVFSYGEFLQLQE
jgi:hypothetical protein